MKGEKIKTVKLRTLKLWISHILQLYILYNQFTVLHPPFLHLPFLHLPFPIFHSSSTILGHYLLYHPSSHIRQPERTTLERIGKRFVVNAHQMQNGCLDIKGLHFTTNRTITDLIGFPIGKAFLIPPPAIQRVNASV